MIVHSHSPRHLNLKVARTAAGPAEEPPEDPKDGVDKAQARRISGFVKRTKLEGANNLRSLTGTMAGQLVGMTIGSMVFAPLAFKTGNFYILTGGAALTGGALALIGNQISKLEPATQKNPLTELAITAAAAAKSLPNFAYPTLAGATGAEKEMIYEALDSLPLSGVTSAPTIDVVTGMQDAGAAGLATPIFSHSRIFLDRDEIGWSREWAQEVTVHEVGHTYDFSKGLGPIGSISQRGGGFGKEPFISHYATTNRMEDFAESYANFHRNPAQLLAKAPDKYAAIAERHQPGLVDQALDRPSVRDAGRKVGTAFEAFPRARNLLALGSSLISPFQLYRGATNFEHGLKNDDPEALFNAKMQLASGSALFFGATTPLALLVAADRFIVGRQLKEGQISLEEANAHADKVLAVSTGPFGFVTSSMESKLEQAGLLIDDDGPELNQLDLSDRKTGLFMAGGLAAGSVVGGLVGHALADGAASSVAAAAAGGTWIGGLVGLAVGYGAHQMLSNSDPYNLSEGDKLTGEDKKLLAKLATPTIAGGIAGAVGGAVAGTYIGRALGQSLAGAAGGVTGAALGKYVGLLTGSWALSKGGAQLGAAWADLPTQ